MEITATLLDNPQEQNKQALTQLAISHDQILATKIASSYITNDKPMLKYLYQKEFYSSATEFNSVIENGQSLEALLINDITKLQLMILRSNEQSLGLSYLSQQTLALVNSEVSNAINTSNQLRTIILANTASNIGMIAHTYTTVFSAKELGAFMDTKKLNTYESDMQSLQNAVSSVEGLEFIFFRTN